MKITKSNLEEFVKFELQLKNRIKDIVIYLIQNDGYNSVVPDEIYDLNFTYELEDENRWHGRCVNVYWTEDCRGERYHESYDFPLEYLCDDVDYQKIIEKNKEKEQKKAELAARKATETKRKNNELKKIEKEKREKELYLKLKEKYED